VPWHDSYCAAACLSSAFCWFLLLEIHATGAAMSSMKSGNVHLCYPRGPDVCVCLRRKTRASLTSLSGPPRQGVVRCYRHALPARKLTAQTALNPNRCDSPRTGAYMRTHARHSDFWRCSLDQPVQCSFFSTYAIPLQRIHPQLLYTYRGHHLSSVTGSPPVRSGAAHKTHNL
jgi:hypothetical protein